MTTTIDPTEETTSLILAGDGYQLTISPEAQVRKADLLVTAATVASVASNNESADAQRVSRALGQMRIEVEKSRKLVKEPVNRIGKLIDQTAKDFLAEVDAEEIRIKRLVGDHAAEVARIKAEKEAAERKAFEEARRAREAAEAAAEAAANTNKMSDVIAAKQAERERAEALAARMDASAEVAAAKVADGVRFAWDFEVEDVEMLYATNRGLVDITPRRADILTEIKRAEAAGLEPTKFFSLQGLRVFKKTVVSSR